MPLAQVSESDIDLFLTRHPLDEGKGFGIIRPFASNLRGARLSSRNSHTVKYEPANTLQRRINKTLLTTAKESKGARVGVRPVLISTAGVVPLSLTATT
jgi:hypothetical protein